MRVRVTSRYAQYGHSERIPDDHSTLVPRLPIPNRTVKRRRADDSVDCPRESRSSSGPYKVKRPGRKTGAFCFVGRMTTEAWPRDNVREHIAAQANLARFCAKLSPAGTAGGKVGHRN